METKKAIVVIGSPAVFATIGMMAAHLSGKPVSVIPMTIAGGVVGLVLAGVAWLFSTRT